MTSIHNESPTPDWHQHVYFLLKSNIRLASALKVQHPIGTNMFSFSAKVQHPIDIHNESPTSDWHQHVYFLLKSNIRLTSTMKAQHPIDTNMFKVQHPQWKPNIRLALTCLFSTKVQHPTDIHNESPTSDWHQHVYFLLKSSIWLASTLKVQHLTGTNMFIFC